MPKLVKFLYPPTFFVLGLLLALTFNSLVFAEETITITTYYPSPYGVYREMRAKRIAIGDTYYDAADMPWEEADADGGDIDYLADLVVEGNVGIGTTVPSYKLHVYGASDAAGNISALVQNTNANGLAFWRSRTSDGIGLNVGAGGPSYVAATILTDNGFVSAQNGLSALVMGTEGSAPIIFYTGGLNASNEKVRINASGNVGIGTTNPGRTLSVAGIIKGHSLIFSTDGVTEDSQIYATTGGVGCTSGGVAIVTTGNSTLCFKDF
ncbi:MAG: hypothetical protein PHI59_08910 [Candidatus Omnitrophica bacterium]|jgi:hypothetical protein|nr:hypothetical protein [Candidatus Omnitrophota bacterium]